MKHWREAEASFWLKREFHIKKTILWMKFQCWLPDFFCVYVLTGWVRICFAFVFANLFQYFADRGSHSDLFSSSTFLKTLSSLWELRTRAQRFKKSFQWSSKIFHKYFIRFLKDLSLWHFRKKRKNKTIQFSKWLLCVTNFTENKSWSSFITIYFCIHNSFNRL